MGRPIAEGGDSGVVADVAASFLGVAWGPLEHEESSG